MSYKSDIEIAQETVMEPISEIAKEAGVDEKYLELGDYNCLAVVSSQTYNSDGIMFEYTQSRHRPDYFRFQDNATRRPASH